MRLADIVLILGIIFIILAGVWIIDTYTRWPTDTKPVVRSISPIGQASMQTVVIDTQPENELKELRDEVAMLKNEIRYRNYYERYSDDYYYYDGDIYPTERFDLTVRVKDDDSNDDIEDARVRLEDGDVEIDYTDDDGKAKFNDLKEDCYELRVSKSGYDTETEDICIHDDRRITVYLVED